MNIAPRIVTLRKLEPQFNRTEFKVLFALAAGAAPMTQKELCKATGLGIGRIDDSIRGLMMHNTISSTDGRYEYNDDFSSWYLDKLYQRNLYAAEPPKTEA